MLNLLPRDNEWEETPVQRRGRDAVKSLVAIVAIGAVIAIPLCVEAYKTYKDHSKLKISWHEVSVRGYKSTYNARYTDDALFICAEKALYQKGKNPFRQNN